MKDKMNISMPTTNDVINDDLVVKRQGGGSIIDHRPLFSNDGETLYVVWKQVIRAYSTQTGDFVREFEPTENKIAGIAWNTDSLNVIIGCTENGVLVNWDTHGLITKNLKLKTYKNIKIRSFNIVNYVSARGNNLQQALITYYIQDNQTIQLVLLDLEDGSVVKSNSIYSSSQDYFIDIVGNYGNNLIALVQDVDLHILQPGRNLTGKSHKIGFGGRQFTCVAGHPDEDCVATGDSSGRVAVWRNLFHHRPAYGSYHWHTLPVTEVVFSRSGGHMYTGGSECVLVKWTLSNPHLKNFLPRLPAPIKHLTIAPNNLYVAVSTWDNGIIVVNPQRKFTAVIQNFTWGVGVSQKDLFPAGLTLDPRTGSLVLNSRTGHVQFFDPKTKSLLYNINITAQNLLTQERSVIIVNTEVTKIALNFNGSWMATIEERDDKKSCPEVRLKFWQFDTEKQVFLLNTSIELPHEYGVNALQFQPRTLLDDEDVLAVTTGEDNKFKLWNLSQASIYKKTRHWQCYGVGIYRELPVSDAGFSQDGSLLGVGFGSSLTIWTPETNTFKCSLTNNRYPQQIKRVEFGKFEACHLVISASSEHIAVWNLLTLSITWSVPLRLTTLTTDSLSSFMAAFTEDNTLFVFTPLNSCPVYTRKNILEDGSSVLAASFVPHPCETRVLNYKKWQKKSQLFFLDSNQELLTLESESEAATSLENLIGGNSGLPATAFSHMLAEQTSSNVERKTSFFHDQFNTNKKSIAEELLTIPAHTLPSKKILYGPFVLSFKAHISQKVKVQEGKPSGEDNELSTDAANDSDDEDGASRIIIKDTPKKEKKLISQSNVKNNDDRDEFETNLKLASYDWTCIADIYST